MVAGAERLLTREGAFTGDEMGVYSAYIWRFVRMLDLEPVVFVVLTEGMGYWVYLQNSMTRV